VVTRDDLFGDIGQELRKTRFTADGPFLDVTPAVYRIMGRGIYECGTRTKRERKRRLVEVVNLNGEH
jgi:hypothetical protein